MEPPKRPADNSLFDLPLCKRIKINDEEDSINANKAINFIIDGNKFHPLFTNQVNNNLGDKRR